MGFKENRCPDRCIKRITECTKKSACQSAQGSYCTGAGVSCNTASMLKSVCAAQITVIENEIKLLTYMKKRIYFAKPNREYFE